MNTELAANGGGGPMPAVALLMTNPATDLLSRAQKRAPRDPEVAECWDFIVKGIELGWLDSDELGELIQHLRAHRDFGVEELLFAHLGDHLRVSFLDDHATCSPAAMTAELEAIGGPR